ncbi:MAG: HAD-IC family P-type ATPase [Patescibacteria group bacterium]
MPDKKQCFFNLSVKDTLKYFSIDHTGLDESEAKNKLSLFGLNKLPEEKPTSAFTILIAQFKSVLIYILLIAAVINFALVCHEHGNITFYPQLQADTYIILLAVLVNVIVGYVQEGKAQKSLQALKQIISLQARIIRNGKERVINALELVPGDIIIVQTGDKIPADARLIEAIDLEINEAALTGESEPVKKITDKLELELGIGDRINMMFTGTTVTKGEGKAIITATGAQTGIGHIAKLIKETKDEETPLQQKLDQFSKKIGVLIIFIALLLVIVGYLQGDPFIEIFTVAVAVAVSALPEGLAVSVTVILALGMQRILKQKALVRKLVSAETLGSTTVICTDKTGTLTEGKMQVTQIVTWDNDFNVACLKEKDCRDKKNEELMFALHAGLLCNDARIDNIDDDINEWVISGNLTEKALVMAAVQAGLNYQKEKKNNIRLDAVPFDSTIKYMATLHECDEKNNIIYFKGAPEKVLERSQNLRIGNAEELFDVEKKNKFQQEFINLSNQGLRVIGIAYKKVSKKTVNLKSESLDDLTFIGYIGIKDPLRTTSKETVRLCQNAGIKVVMITGDHKLTARAIAKDLKMPSHTDNIIEGSDLDKMTDEQLVKCVQKISVYARVSPEHKLRIVKAWQKKGEVVAMTGDGINDSPALKAADIGVVLGSGTQVAKETADMVILDDHFKSIVGAVEEGRGIFDNIKKTVLYLISDSFSEVILVLGSMLFNLPIPMTAAQILWINLVNDTLPSLALTQEPRELEVMQESPRGRKGQILDREIKTLIFVISGITGVAGIILFYIYYKLSGDIILARTVVFAAGATDSLLYIFSVRTMRRSIFKYNLFINKYLVGAVFVSFLFLLAAIYIPFLQEIVKTKPLEIFDWIVVLMLSFFVVFFIELIKYLFLKKKRV